MFKVGDLVAWKMLDGNTMSGSVVAVFYDNYDVRRVDGGCVTVEAKIVRQATPDDIESACQFFLNIGKK